MASSGIAGAGAEFRRWSITDQAWAVIAEITTITGPSMTRDVIDVTSLDSTDKYREFIAGFRNGGTVGLAMIFTRVTYEIMKDDYESDTEQNYEMVLPDAETTSLEFVGLITELPLTIPAEDKITCDVTIQISGSVNMMSGSGISHQSFRSAYPSSRPSEGP